MNEKISLQWIPAQWLELACWNRPMVVYSRTIEIPQHDRRISDKPTAAPSAIATLLATLAN
jgi:hypothetical protein